MMDELRTKSGFFGRGRMESAGRDGRDWVEKGHYLEFVKTSFFWKWVSGGGCDLHRGCMWLFFKDLGQFWATDIETTRFVSVSK